ncbi:MAG TPA: CHAT domain-containing tetratricopeptide repeat protein [Blastocatellia bacterium]|nr:CHAT domain-containing tetratricopeptide repeat protein [Blastocatellia bacterium]
MSLIAAASGAYQFVVHSPDKEAAPGTYRLSVGEVRQATSLDKSRIAAEVAFAEGGLLRETWEEQACREAIRKYQAALAAWQKAGEQQQAVIALHTIGEVYYSLSELKTALKYYELALSQNSGSNNARSRSDTLNEMSSVCLYLGQHQRAMECANKALELSREAGYRSGEVLALNNLGEYHFWLGEKRQSLGFYDQALALCPTLNDRRLLAHTLMNFGYTHSDLGNTGEAFDYYARALKLWRAVGHRRGEALALTATGQLYSHIGEKQEALNFYAQAAGLFNRIGDRLWEAVNFNSAAYAYLGLGELQRALGNYDRARRLWQAVSYDQGVVQSLVQIGEVHYALGNHRRALDYYQQALPTLRTLRLQRAESYTLNYIGRSYAALGDRQKSLAYYQEALSLYRLGGNRQGEAYLINDIGNVYRALNKQERALEYYKQALALNQTVGDHFGESQTHYHLAAVEHDSGNLPSARAEIEAAIKIIESLRSKVISQELRTSYFASIHQHYQLYLDILMHLHQQHPAQGFEALALAVSERARARSLLELLAEARADIRQGVEPDLLERERTLGRALDGKAGRLARLLGGQHQDAELAAATQEAGELTAQYNDLQAQIRARSPRYAALTQPQPLSLTEIQQQVLDADTLMLEYALGDERSHLWAVTPDSIASFELPKRAEIEAAARRVYDLLTAPNQHKPLETPQQRLARISRAESEYVPAATALSRMILGPVAAQLGNKRLLVVSEGTLQYVPFGALPVPASGGQGEGGTGGRGDRARRTFSSPLPLSPSPPLPVAFTPLVVEHEIVSLPSASTLGVLRRELAGRKPAPKAVAVLADPVFDAADERVRAGAGQTLAMARGAGTTRRGATPRAASKTSPAAITTDLERAIRSVRISRHRGAVSRLPFSRQEADAILEAAPPDAAMKAVDFQASYETATSAELAQYRIIHFATHGLLNTEQPYLSGVLLSLVDERGRPKQGFLQLHEIYNLRLPAELVVLSACQTGLGKDISGEGLVGLVRGFMYAGAARVVASLWKVDDLATAELMKRFYREMLGKGLAPAAALRAAQVGMWRQPSRRSPYYWAAFELQGEWK